MGLLGRGIATCFLGHGFEVVAVARSQARHAEARRQIEQMIGELVDLAGFDPSLRTEWASRYTAACEFEPVRDCGFVVESVLEDAATKHDVFDRIEAVVSPEAVIASNSSAIPISQLQRARQAERSLHLIETGVADAETIDRSMRNALGLWATVCGPLRWMDLTGGPELYFKAMQPVLPTLSKADEPSPVLKKLAESGARGIVNGRGFFNYTPEEAQRWEELYRRHAWRVAQMQNEYFPLAGGDAAAPKPNES
jgi:3-hydroxyacyl-CoA dehydrogenase